jgi:hypothetical protein
MYMYPSAPCEKKHGHKTEFLYYNDLEIFPLKGVWYQKGEIVQ